MNTNISFKWFPESWNTAGYNDRSWHEQYDWFDRPRVKEINLLESAMSNNDGTRSQITDLLFS